MLNLLLAGASLFAFLPLTGVASISLLLWHFQVTYSPESDMFNLINVYMIIYVRSEA